MNINYNLGTQADWLHCNGLDYNATLDQIVISAHNQNEIYILDHSTTLQQVAGHLGGTHGKAGDFLYRWGNPAAYNRGVLADKKLFGQHNPNWIPYGYPDGGSIMIFNNGINRLAVACKIPLPRGPGVSLDTECSGAGFRALDREIARCDVLRPAIKAQQGSSGKRDREVWIRCEVGLIDHRVDVEGGGLRYSGGVVAAERIKPNACLIPRCLDAGRASPHCRDKAGIGVF